MQNQYYVLQHSRNFPDTIRYISTQKKSKIHLLEDDEEDEKQQQQKMNIKKKVDKM